MSRRISFLAYSTALSLGFLSIPFHNADAQTASAHIGAHSAKHTPKKKKKASTVAPAAAVTPVAAPVASSAPVSTVAPAPAASPTAAQVARTNRNAEVLTVTGSRLISNSIDQTEPTITVSSQQITRRGYSNIGTALLRENTAFGTPSSSPMGNQSGNGTGAGQFFANLLNLGSEHTLTVVNGIRFTPGASASQFGNISGSAVDLTEIPDSLIDQVQTVLTGGAPTYGADAIAGTVNVILKNDFQGFQANGQAGWTQKLDGLSNKESILFGHHFDHDRGGIVVDVEYTHNQSILGNSRHFSGENQPWDQTVAGQPYENQLATGGLRSLLYTQSGIPSTSDVIPYQNGNQSGIMNAAGQTLIFSNNGKSLVPLNFGQVDSYGYNAQTGNGYPSNKYTTLLANVSRVNFVTLGHYDILPNVRFHWETWYERYNSVSPNNGGYPVTALDNSAGNVNGNFILNTNNPFLTASESNTINNALQSQGVTNGQFYLSDLNQQIGQTRYETQTELYRFVTGLNGDFDLLHRNWQWEGTFQYGRNAFRDMQNQVLIQNLNNALNVTTDASGNPACVPGYQNASIPSLSSVCAPFNPFGTDQASQASVDYIHTFAKQQNKNTLMDFVGDIKGNIVHLPAGPWKIAVGYEHRRETNNYNPGAFYESGEGVDVPILPVAGAYHTNEGFAETDIPLVSPAMNIPFIYHASANSSARYIDNSYTGAFWTYTGGGALSITKDITVNGNYTRSVRAPGVAELDQPLSSSYETGDDPCDTNYINGGPNPAIRAANCAKAGVPQGFLSNISNNYIQGKSGGNTRLHNEIGTSKSIGVTLTPRWIKGLSIQGNYVNIRINGLINAPGVQYDMDACYDSASYPNSSFCSLFTRDGNSHQITHYVDQDVNVGLQKTRAVVSKIDYMLPLQRVGLGADSGAIDFSGNYTHTLNSYQLIGGTQQYSVNTPSNPRDLVTLNLTYSWHDSFFQWQTLWYGRSSNIVNEAPNYLQYPKSPSYQLFNATMGYSFLKHYTATFAINNVLGTSPPFPYQNDVTRYYDAVLGRSFNFQILANY